MDAHSKKRRSRNAKRSPFPPIDPLDGSLVVQVLVGQPGVVIADVVRVSVARVRGDKVSLLIQAPTAITIVRCELLNSPPAPNTEVPNADGNETARMETPTPCDEPAGGAASAPDATQPAGSV